jgi:hypothetical protein
LRKPPQQQQKYPDRDRRDEDRRDRR